MHHSLHKAVIWNDITKRRPNFMGDALRFDMNFNCWFPVNHIQHWCCTYINYTSCSKCTTEIRGASTYSIIQLTEQNQTGHQNVHLTQPYIKTSQSNSPLHSCSAVTIFVMSCVASIQILASIWFELNTYSYPELISTVKWSIPLFFILRRFCQHFLRYHDCWP